MTLSASNAASLTALLATLETVVAGQPVYWVYTAAVTNYLEPERIPVQLLVLDLLRNRMRGK